MYTYSFSPRCVEQLYWYCSFVRFHGESEKNLVTKFTEAKEKEPCIILLDDVDCLCVRRDTSQSDVEKRVASTLLTLFDDLVRVCTF